MSKPSPHRWAALFAPAFLLFFSPSRADQTPFAQEPAVLVLYDGRDVEGNPGRLDALYLTNLLGHFTTRRKVQPIEDYQPDEWRKYDAVFAIIFQKHYEVPALFVRDIARSDRTFCWLGNQPGQLDREGILRRHGLAFLRFEEKKPLNHVWYKDRVVAKGDLDTNLFQVIDAKKADVVAYVGDEQRQELPYIAHSGTLWLVGDSPFSFAGEADRYLVFCDVLHDILGINHPESHSAILRVEDINALSKPEDLEATLKVIRRRRIPFAFGFVPTYINPHERLDYRLTDKPDVVRLLKRYVEAGGAAVLHGFTHQYRGVTTDDYEFWDDIGDRPVRGDSEAFASKRVEEAIKESFGAGIYPVTWETPHYAGSPTDYRVFRRYFETVFERRLIGRHLGTDQYFPYPVVDLYGQYIIPENLSYVPIDSPKVEPLLVNADAARVVRDGYASFFFHPFLDPALLDRLIAGIQQRGFHFADIKAFPNEVHFEGRVVKTTPGLVDVAGRGRYLTELVVGASGRERPGQTTEVAPDAVVRRSVNIRPGETYVASRQDLPPPSVFKRLIQFAKGDVSGFHRKLETVMGGRLARNPMQTLVLWDSKAEGPAAVDQQSFYSALSALGYDVERIDYTHLSEEEMGPFTMLVVPWGTAQALPGEMVSRIVGALTGGITVITDGESPLSQALGIRLGDPIPVGALQDHFFTSQETRWPDKPSVPWVMQPKPDEMDIFYSDRDEHHPLVVSAAAGEGRYLYFAPLFDAVSGQGYARFPNVAQILIQQMGLTPIVHRAGAEAYFDPGYRQNISIEVLAKMWRRYGIRAVHVAGWGFYDKYTYDYARLLRVAHENGILVYAWFEWPHVSQKFWNKHPAWREKTATQMDAHVDWRYLMNLEDPQCLKAVLSEMKDFLRQYDWDGVNVGELTFESAAGPERPEFMTPFNKQARQAFQARGGFDPEELFQTSSTHYWKNDPAGLKAFYDFRRQENARLLSLFLENIQKIGAAEKRQWDIAVTVLDVLQHPELSDTLGIDLDRTVTTVNARHATLQVEDPAVEWSKGPERYVRLGERYHDIRLARPFMIDINVLPVHPASQRGFATAQPTGVEMAQLWRSAASQANRVCLYSESSIFEQDWQLLPYAMAGQASVKKEGDNWIVKTPNTVHLDVGRDAKRFRLDGEPWYCADKGEVIIPAGEHLLSFVRAQRSWFDTTQLETRLVDITGELVASHRARRGLDVEYEAPHRCAVIFNKLPYKTYLDDQPVKLSAIRGDRGYTVLAPPGHHRLRVFSETPGLYLVEFTSLVTASLIVLFGLASSGLLAFLFIFIFVTRRLRKLGRKVSGRWSAEEDSGVIPS